MRVRAHFIRSRRWGTGIVDSNKRRLEEIYSPRFGFQRRSSYVNTYRIYVQIIGIVGEGSMISRERVNFSSS